MGFALQPNELRIIKAALRFANLKRVDYARMARSFDVAKTRAQPLKVDSAIGMPMPSKTWEEPLHLVQAPVALRDRVAKEAHTVVRTWLGQIAVGKTRDVARDIASFLPGNVQSMVSFEGRRLRLSYRFSTINGVLALAMAFLLDEERGLTSRLKQCGYSKCGRFHLNLAPEGRPRRFCSDEHARLHSNETSRVRQARYRRKHQLTSKERT